MYGRIRSGVLARGHPPFARLTGKSHEKLCINSMVVRSAFYLLDALHGGSQAAKQLIVPSPPAQLRAVCRRAEASC